MAKKKGFWTKVKEVLVGKDKPQKQTTKPKQTGTQRHRGGGSSNTGRGGTRSGGNSNTYNNAVNNARSNAGGSNNRGGGGNNNRGGGYNNQGNNRGGNNNRGGYNQASSRTGDQSTSTVRSRAQTAAEQAYKRKQESERRMQEAKAKRDAAAKKRKEQMEKEAKERREKRIAAAQKAAEVASGLTANGTKIGEQSATFGTQHKKTTVTNSRGAAAGALSKGTIKPKSFTVTEPSEAEKNAHETEAAKQKLMRETVEKKKQKAKEFSKATDDSIRKSIAYYIKNNMDVSDEDYSKVFKEIYDDYKKKYGGEVKKGAKKYGEAYAKEFAKSESAKNKKEIDEKYSAGKVTAKDLSKEEFGRMVSNSVLGPKLGNAALGKDLAKKVGDITAINANKNAMSAATHQALQGIAFADIDRGGIGTYSKEARKLLQESRERTAGQIGYGVGTIGGFAVGGVGKIGQGIVKGAGEKAAKKLLQESLEAGVKKDTKKLLEESLAERVGNEAASRLVKKMAAKPNSGKLIADALKKQGMDVVEDALKKQGIDVAQTAAKTTGGKAARNVVADMAASSPMDLMDAVKMSRDENGKIDRKAFATILALNVGLGGAAGSAMEAGTRMLAGRAGRKLVSLQAKANAGNATEAELKELDSLYNKVASSKNDIYSSGSNIAEQNFLKARASVESARLERRLGAKGYSPEQIQSIVSKQEVSDYIALKAKETSVGLTDAQKRQMAELSAKVALQKSRYENTLQEIVTETEQNVGRASAVDVARLRKAEAYFQATGNKAALKKTQALVKKAEKNMEKTFGTVTKAAAKVSGDLGRDFKIESADEILESFAKTGGKVNDPSQLHGFTEFDKDGNIIAYHVNKDSEQALEYTFGHEFTHGFETLKKEYSVFKEDLKKFVGDEWDDEMARVKSNYADVANANYENEVVANLVAKHFFSQDGTYLKKLAGENPSLFARIYHMIKKLVAGSTEADAQLEALSKQMDDMLDLLSDHNKSIALGSPDTSEMLFGGGRTLQDIIDSGVNAQTAQELADNLQFARDALKYAIKQSKGNYEELAKARKQIFKDYGWFEGYDGKWRYEIDDSRMRYNLGKSIKTSDASGGRLVYLDKNTGKITAASEDVVQSASERLTKLTSKKKLTKKESSELQGLRTQMNLYLALTSKDGVPLGRVLSHDKFFELYPEAKNLKFKIRADGEWGDINPMKDPNINEAVSWGEFDGNDSLILNAHLFASGSNLVKRMETAGIDPAFKIRETTAHEIQHYIQDVEKFASGSDPSHFSFSPKYGWEKDAASQNMYPKNYERDADALQAINDKKEDIGYDIEDLVGESEWDDFKSKYFPIIQDISDEELGVLGKGGFVDNVYLELTNSIDPITVVSAEHERLIKDFLSKDYDAAMLAERNPHVVYEQTAGEVEAREVGSRVNMSKNERKKAYPVQEGIDIRYAEHPTSKYGIDKDMPKRKTNNPTNTTRLSRTELSYGIDHERTARIGGKVSRGDASYGYARDFAEDLERNGYGVDYIAEKTELIRDSNGDWVIADLAGKYNAPEIDSLTPRDYAIIGHQVFKENVDNGRFDEGVDTYEARAYVDDKIIVCETTGGANYTPKSIHTIPEKERTSIGGTIDATDEKSNITDTRVEAIGRRPERHDNSYVFGQYGREGGQNVELAGREPRQDRRSNRSEGVNAQPRTQRNEIKKTERSYGGPQDEDSYYASLAADMEAAENEFQEGLSAYNAGEMQRAEAPRGHVSDEVREEIKSQTLGDESLTDAQVDKLAEAQVALHNVKVVIPESARQGTVKQIRANFGIDEDNVMLPIVKSSNAKNAQSVGDAYAQLSKDYPELFPESIKDEAEQFKRLMDVSGLKGGAQSRRGRYYVPRERTMQPAYRKQEKPVPPAKGIDAAEDDFEPTKEMIQAERESANEWSRYPDDTEAEIHPKDAKEKTVKQPEAANVPKEKPPVEEAPVEKNGMIERERRENTKRRENDTAAKVFKEMDEAYKDDEGWVNAVTGKRQNGAFGKLKVKNSVEADEYATKEFENLGYEKMLKNYFVAEAADDPYVTMARASKLLGEIDNRLKSGKYDAAELYDEATDIIEKFSGLTTLGSHILNSAKKFMTATPQGTRKVIDKEIARLEQRYKDRIKGGKLIVDNDLVERIMKASGSEKDALLAELNQSLWEQIPASLMERMNEYRHCFMLFNARTHGRNVFGNAVFRVVRAISDEMENKMLQATKGHIAKLEGVDKNDVIIDKVHVSRKETYENRGYLENEFHAIYDTSGSRNKYIEMGRPADVPTVKFKPIQWLINKNYDALEAEDLKGALKPAFNKAYVSYCKARCPEGTELRAFMEDMTPAQKEKARQYALFQGEYATFRDSCAFSDWLIAKKQTFAGKTGNTKWGTLGYRALDTVLEGAVPFVKTPVNIFRRSVDYSPASLVMSVGKLANAKDADTFKLGVHQLCTGLTGTGMMGLGVFLAQQGLVTVKAGEESGDSYYDRDMGYQDYSLVIPMGDKEYSWTIDWMSPMGMSLFTGAAFQKMFDKEGYDNTAALNAFFACTSPLTDMSFMSSPKDTMQRFLENATRSTTSDGETDFAGALAQLIVGDIPKNYVSGFFPQLTAQLAGFIDPVQRDTKSTAENVYVKGWQSSGRQLLNKDPMVRLISSNDDMRKLVKDVPVLHNILLNPKLDRQGNDKEIGGNIVTRFCNAFLNPANVKEITKNDTDRELINIRNHMDKDSKDYKYFYYNFTGNPSYDLADGKRMTYDEAYKYGKSNRIEQNNIIDVMLKAPSYEGMTWKMKADEVDDAHWIGTTKADLDTYKANYAMKSLLKNNDREKESYMEYKRLAGAGEDTNKKYVEYYLDKERLLARSHATGDDTYRIKGITAIESGDKNLLKSLDIHKSKIDDLSHYWDIVTKESKSKKKAKQTAFDELSDGCCRIMSFCNAAEMNNPSKGVKSTAAGMAAAEGNQIKERVYRAYGHNWNSAQSGGGLMLKYNEDGKYSIERIQEMKSVLRNQFDLDESGSVNKKEVLEYIDSLGVDSEDEKACLYEVLYNGGRYKNPYKAEIDDHLKWGENRDDEWGQGNGSGKGWGRRRRGGGGWGHGGGGGGGGGASSPRATVVPETTPKKLSPKHSSAKRSSGGGGKVSNPEVNVDYKKGVTPNVQHTVNYKPYKAKAANLFQMKDYTKPSNLDDAYRKKAKKLREASRKKLS